MLSTLYGSLINKITHSMKIHGNQLVEILPLRDLYTIYDEHHRLTVFVNKGRCCVSCNREGVFLLKTQQKDGSEHVDLYTDDFVMITVDHTVPKKIAKELGWTTEQIESLDNKEPMCGPCNWNKGHKAVTNKEWAVVRAKVPSAKRTGTEVIWDLVSNPNVFDKTLAF